LGHSARFNGQTNARHQDHRVMVPVEPNRAVQPFKLNKQQLSRVWRRFFLDQRIMTNDTVVFDAMRFDIRIGQYIWSRRVGTPVAIKRDGLFIAGCLNIARTNGSTRRATSIPNWPASNLIRQRNLPGPNPRRAGGQLAAMACKGCGGRCLARSSVEQFVANPRTLGEPGVTRFLERRDVDEHVLPATIRLDKSISLGWIKPLHRPHRHVSISLKR